MTTTLPTSTRLWANFWIAITRETKSRGVILVLASREPPSCQIFRSTTTEIARGIARSGTGQVLYRQASNHWHLSTASLGTSCARIVPSAYSLRRANLQEGCLSDRSATTDRKSTRLNSSHLVISYAVFCLKKKKA